MSKHKGLGGKHWGENINASLCFVTARKAMTFGLNE